MRTCALLAVLGLMLTGCAAQGSLGDEAESDTVEVICPYAPGTGATGTPCVRSQ